MKMMRVENEGPPMGNYEYSPLRTVTLTSLRNVADMVAPLRQWAESGGYKFLVDSPTGEPGSISFEMWQGEVVVTGLNRLGAPGLQFPIYWNGDTADNQMLDEAAEQLRTTLAPFGAVEVTSAPPGTPPRKETELYGRQR